VPGLVAFYDIRPGDGVGLFLAPEPTRGDRIMAATVFTTTFLFTTTFFGAPKRSSICPAVLDGTVV